MTLHLHHQTIKMEETSCCRCIGMLLNISKISWDWKFAASIYINRTIASSIIQEYWLHPRYTKFGTSLKCLLILFWGQNLETFLCQQCEYFFYEITFTFKSSDTSWQALFTFVCVNESRSHLLFSTFSLNLISFFRLAMKWPYLKWAKCVLPLGNKKR